VVETPVEESVRLRDETINVERRRVDRPAGDITGDAFRERTIELTETDEEAVVAKTARVTEEVVISKDVTERTERVSDTVRRTEVDVENTAGTDRAVNRDVKVDRDLKADRDRDI
jgi:stress response protein YsnF